MLTSRNVPRTALRRVTKLKQVASARELHRQAASTNVHDLLVTYAQKSTRPLTLSKLLSFGHPLTPDSILASASYALTEIPRRLARRIHSLEKLPFIVGTNPYVARTLDSFRSSFEWLARYPEVTTLRENEEFAKQLEMLVEKHKDDIPRMAKG
jgi:26S proteasome regulatory subunit T1